MGGFKVHSDKKRQKPRHRGGVMCLLLSAAVAVAGLGQIRRAANIVVAADAAAAPVSRPSTRPSQPWPLHVPSPLALANADLLVHSAFKGAYAAAAAPSAAGRRQVLARRMLEQAALADDDAAERFILLREAIQLSANSGDIVTAMRGLYRMEKTFGLTPRVTREAVLGALGAAGGGATSAIDKETVAQSYLQFIEAARAVGDYDLAFRAINSAKAMRDRAKNDLLDAQLTIPTDVARKEAEASAAALVRLRTNASDPDANLAAGRYRCFWSADWETGAPLLAKGSDVGLKNLALLDIAGADAAAIADAWWAAADEQKETINHAMRLRAATWYQRCAPSLAEAARNRASKRLEDVRASAMQPGLIGELYNGENFGRRRVVRIDPRINFDWDMAAPDPRVDADHFSISWQGYISAPAGGEYVLDVAADDGVVVRIDGADVLNEWHTMMPAYQVKVKLTGAPQRFELLYNDLILQAYMKLGWILPSEKKSAIIPTSAFWHDPVWPWGPMALTTGFRPADAIAALPEEKGDSARSGPSWLKKIDDELPWYAAQRRCEQLGGHLAWTQQPEDYDFVSRVADNGNVYLGGSDEEIENRWEWTNFQRFDPGFHEWAENEPNGGRAENYLNWRNTGWNDSDSRKQFICQWDR